MQQQTTAALTAIFSEVLANLAFMFTDDAEVDETRDDQWLETTISFHGSTNGTLRLACTRGFATLLEANLLGVDVDDDSLTSDGQDGVKEFMNILCGQYITASYGTDEVFDLSIPQIRELGEPPPQPQDRDSHASTLFVDGHRLHLTFLPGQGSVDQ